MLVVDLLSEELYQYIIEWEKLKDLDVEILHRIFEKTAGPCILPNLGLFVKNDIFSRPSDEVLELLAPCKFIERDYFEGKDRLIFEENLKEIGWENISREIPNEREIENEMKKKVGEEYWNYLSEREKNYLVHGERHYHEIQAEEKRV